jgi:DNA-binding MarR family transcriptional regulator
VKIEVAIKQGKPFRNTYHKVAVNLIFTGKWIINYHNELLKSLGLTLQQYNMLRILRGQYPKAVTVKLIRERMLDKMSDASRIVENLRKKELVTRDVNVKDRRRVNVAITQKGLTFLANIEEKVNIKTDRFVSRLNLNEIDQLNTLLDKLRG